MASPVQEMREKLFKELAGINEPRIYNDLSSEMYHQGPGWSSTQIKSILKNPYAFWHFNLNEDREIDEDEIQEEADHFRVGRLIHTLTLEPHLLEEEFHIISVGSRNAKAYKDALEAAHLAGKTIALEKEVEEAGQMALAVRNNSRAMKLLDGAILENSIYWRKDGRLVKCRPDIWNQEIDCLVDLKSAANAEPYKFQRSVFDYGYDISAAMYSEGIEALTNKAPRLVAWVVVEKAEPYTVKIYAATEPVLARGSRLYEKALNTLAECEEAGIWPAYGDDRVIPIELPPWLMKEEAENG